MVKIFEIRTQASKAWNRDDGVDEFCHFLTGLYLPPFGGSGFSTFFRNYRKRLLAFLRARLSTLLYKSIKQMGLFDFDITNV